ncbi:MAG: hypothetical protein ACOC5A_03250 [Halanaerobiales bacterium]
MVTLNISALGWDSGFDFEKLVMGDNKSIAFPATVMEVEDEFSSFTGLESMMRDFSEDNMVVNFKGNRYYVGNKAVANDPEAGIRNFDPKRFEHSETIVRLLGGITLLAGENQGITVENLIVGLNIEDYKVYRRDIEKVYKNKKFTIEVPQNGTMEKVHIKIKNVKCVTQGFGAYYNFLLDNNGQVKNRELKDSWNGVVDIGGRTTDLLIAEGSDPKPGTVMSFDLGTSDAFKSVAKKIGGGISYTLIEEKYLKGNEKANIAGKQYNIQNMCREAFNDLAIKLRNRILTEWDDYMVRVNSIIFTGGGASVVFDYFQDDFPAFVKMSKDPQLDNARGYYKLGQLVVKNSSNESNKKETAVTKEKTKKKNLREKNNKKPPKQKKQKHRKQNKNEKKKKEKKKKEKEPTDPRKKLEQAKKNFGSKPKE